MGADRIGVVVCNTPPLPSEFSVGDMDIGGPAMINAAIKNYRNVLVFTSPSQYSAGLERLGSQALSVQYRQELASQAAQHVAAYSLNVAALLELS